MNDIALVLGSNIHWAPYYYRYEKILDEFGSKFDLLMWNREGIEEESKGYLLQFDKKDNTDNKDAKKVIKFIEWSAFVKNNIIRNNYKKIVFLGTHAAAPLLLSGFLGRKYKGKYWIDIRDRVLEGYKFMYKLECGSISNSFATCISSKGYESFLPPHNYYYMHNIDPNMDELVNEYQHIPSDTIRISFIGNVRYYDENIKLLSVFANDKRFTIQYFGAGSEKLQNFCKAKEITNVKFCGRFDPRETIHFYNQTDIINNVYGNDKIGLKTALSNKYYYGLRLHIPLLTSKETYMEEICKKDNICFTFDYNPKYPDLLFEEYQRFRKNNMIAGFDSAWKRVVEEDDNAIVKFKEFLLD